MKYKLDKEKSLNLFEKVKDEKINVRKTIENAFRDDFEFSYLFYVLSENDKVISDDYPFSSVSDHFIDFINEKINENGVFISLVRVIDDAFNEEEIIDTLIDDEGEYSEKVLGIETGLWRKNLKTKRDISAYELAEFGVKIQKVDGEFKNSMGQIAHGSPMVPSFEEFGSTRGNEKLLSLDYPLNLMAIEWIYELLVFE